MEETLDNSVEMFNGTDEDSDEDSDSPLLDMFVVESGDPVYKAMTPFTKNEFEQVWDDISVEYQAEYQNTHAFVQEFSYVCINQIKI